MKFKNLLLKILKRSLKNLRKNPMAINLYECRAQFALLKRPIIFRKGFLFISKKELIFKSHGYEPETVQKVTIREIARIINEKRGANNYLKIINLTGETHGLYAIYNKRGKPKPDNNKTNSIYSLLISLRIDMQQKIIEPLKKMMEVSTRINLNMLKETLDIESSIFYQNIFNLASKLGLIIDGDSLKIDNVSKTDFIRALNEYMNLGISNELFIDEKLSCQYCWAPLKPNSKFCIQCGTTLVKDAENNE